MKLDLGDLITGLFQTDLASFERARSTMHLIGFFLRICPVRQVSVLGMHHAEFSKMFINGEHILDRHLSQAFLFVFVDYTAHFYPISDPM